VFLYVLFIFVYFSIKLIVKSVSVSILILTYTVQKSNMSYSFSNPILTPVPSHYRRVMVFDVETNGLLPRDFKLEDITPELLITLPHILQLSCIVYNIVSNRIEQTYNAYIRVSDDVEISDFITNLTGISREVVQTKGKPIAEVLERFYQIYMKCDMVIAHNIDFDYKLIGIAVERHMKGKANYAEMRQLFTRTFNEKHEIDLYCTMMATIDLCRLPKCTSTKPNIPAITYEDKSSPSATLSTSLEALINIPRTPTLVVRKAEKSGVIPVASLQPVASLTKPKRVYTNDYKFPKLNELHQKLFESVPENLHNSLIDVIVCLRCFLKIRCCLDITDRAFARMMRTAIEMSERTSG
jgi:DNA polymerase III epsilon subunit-like protein